MLTVLHGGTTSALHNVFNAAPTPHTPTGHDRAQLGTLIAELHLALETQDHKRIDQARERLVVASAALRREPR